MDGTTWHDRRDLAHRAVDGLEVSLLWCDRTGTVSVAVWDTKSGDAFELVVGEGERALDVFHHPYAYAAFRGVDFRGHLRETALATAA